MREKHAGAVREDGAEAAMATGRRQEEGDTAVDRANGSRGVWGQPGPGAALFYGGAAQLHPRAGPAPSSHPSLALLASWELFWSRDVNTEPCGRSL